MALLPVAWKAATREDVGMAPWTNAERNGCWTAGLKAEETRVEAVLEEVCLLGAALNACLSILERAIEAIVVHSGWID